METNDQGHKQVASGDLATSKRAVVSLQCRRLKKMKLGLGCGRIFKMKHGDAECEAAATGDSAG